MTPTSLSFPSYVEYTNVPMEYGSAAQLVSDFPEKFFFVLAVFDSVIWVDFFNVSEEGSYGSAPESVLVYPLYLTPIMRSVHCVWEFCDYGEPSVIGTVLDYCY